MPAPSVTVLIATYNRAHLIRTTLDSILAQTRPPDSVIVVDDGSGDDTPAVLAEYGDRITRIEKTNGGKSSALNLAMASVDSDYVWVFDDDDIALPDALETHLAHLANYHVCDLTYSANFVFTDTNEAHPAEWRRHDIPEVATGRFLLWMLESHFLPAAMQGMLVATDLYRRAGAFDTVLARSQDRDMVMRLARLARPCAITTPTWALREHSGMRGPSGAQHGAAERYDVWWQYKTHLFGKVHANLALHEYLPGGAFRDEETVSLDLDQTRQALLQRAVIMATHGLFDKALEDFETYMTTDQASRSARANLQQRTLISRLSHIHTSDCVPPLRYYQGLGSRVDVRDGHLPALVRGVYWSVRRDLTNGDYRLARRGVVRLSTLTLAALVPLHRLRNP